MAVFESVGVGYVEIVFGWIVVIVIGLRHVILFSGLCLAAIALLPKGEIEIVAIKTDPISLSRLRGSLMYLIDQVAIFYGRKIVHDISNYTKC